MPLKQLKGIWETIGTNLLSVTLALTPIIVIFLFFNFSSLNYLRKKIIGILLSTLVVFVGLFIFLFGIDFGFAFAGNYIGKVFIQNETYKWFLIPISFVLGFAITLTEPAVVVLGGASRRNYQWIFKEESYQT